MTGREKRANYDDHKSNYITFKHETLHSRENVE